MNSGMFHVASTILRKPVWITVIAVGSLEAFSPAIGRVEDLPLTLMVRPNAPELPAEAPTVWTMAFTVGTSPLPHLSRLRLTALAIPAHNYVGKPVEVDTPVQFQNQKSSEDGYIEIAPPQPPGISLKASGHRAEVILEQAHAGTSWTLLYRTAAPRVKARLCVELCTPGRDGNEQIETLFIVRQFAVAPQDGRTKKPVASVYRPREALTLRHHALGAIYVNAFTTPAQYGSWRVENGELLLPAPASLWTAVRGGSGQEVPEQHWPHTDVCLAAHLRVPPNWREVTQFGWCNLGEVHLCSGWPDHFASVWFHDGRWIGPGGSLGPVGGEGERYQDVRVEYDPATREWRGFVETPEGRMVPVGDPVVRTPLASSWIELKMRTDVPDSPAVRALLTNTVVRIRDVRLYPRPQTHPARFTAGFDNLLTAQDISVKVFATDGTTVLGVSIAPTDAWGLCKVPLDPLRSYPQGAIVRAYHQGHLIGEGVIKATETDGLFPDDTWNIVLK